MSLHKSVCIKHEVCSSRRQVAFHCWLQAYWCAVRGEWWVASDQNSANIRISCEILLHLLWFMRHAIDYAQFRVCGSGIWAWCFVICEVLVVGCTCHSQKSPPLMIKATFAIRLHFGCAPKLLFNIHICLYACYSTPLNTYILVVVCT